MGAALNMAGAMGGYVLADRGTWIGFKGQSAIRSYAIDGRQSLFSEREAGPDVECGAREDERLHGEV